MQAHVAFRRGRRTAAIAALVLCAGQAASAQTTWSPTTPDFNTPGNWTAGVPAATVQALFNNTPIAANRLLTFTGNASVGSMSFSGATTTYTFTSTTNTLTFDNGGAGASITADAGTSSNTDFNLAVNILDAAGLSVTNNGTGVVRFNAVGTQALTIGAGGLSLNGSGNFAMSGTGDVTGSGSITMNSTGVVTIGAGNTWTGKFFLNAGSLNASADTCYGAVPGSFVADAFTFNGGTINTTTSHTINANRGMTINAGGMTWAVVSGLTATYGGTISGAGALTKSTAGTLTLTSGNTYMGGTTITGGRVNFNASGAAGSGAITVGPVSTVTLANSSTGDVTLNNDWTLISSAFVIDVFNSSATTGANFTLAGDIGGAGNLSRGAGGGVQLVSLTGNNASWTGSLILTGNSTSSATPIFVAPSSFHAGNLQFGTSGNFLSVLLSSGTFSRTLGTGAGQAQWVGTGGTGLAARGGPLSVSLNGGAGLTWGAGNFVNSGQTLALGAATFADDVVTVQNDILLTTAAAATRIVNVIDNTGSANDRAVLAGALTETPTFAGTLEKTGTGTLVLANAGNNYSGGTRLNGGTLAFTQDGNLGAAASPLTFVAASTLSYQGAGAASMNRAITISAAPTFEVTNPAATLTSNGTGTGTSNINKTGPGTLNFGGPHGTGSGGANINEGTLALIGAGGALPGTGTVTVGAGTRLVVDNSLANNNNRLGGAVTLAPGAEFVFRGNGSVATAESFGSFNPINAAGTAFLTLDRNGGPGVALTSTGTLTVPGITSFAVVRAPGLGIAGQEQVFLNTPAAGTLPGVLGDFSPAGAGSFLVGYDIGVGVRPAAFTLNGNIDNTVPPPAPADAFHNNGASGASNTIGAANTIAGLQLSGPGPTINASSGALTISSGMVLVTPGTMGATISGGSLSSTALLPMRLFTLAPLNLGSSITTTASSGLIKWGASGLTLTAPNVLAPTGPTIIQEGAIISNNFAQTAGGLSGPTGTSLAMGSGNLTLAQTSSNTFAGTLSGSGRLAVNGNFTQTFSGNTSGMTGPVSVTGATLALIGQSALATSAPITLSNAGGVGATFNLINTAVTSGPPDRLPNAPAIRMTSSRLNLLGSTTAGVHTSQAFGALSGTGFNTIALTTVAASQTVATFAGIDQASPNVGWYLYGVNALGTAAPAGGISNIFFSSAPILSTTGGGAPGTNTVSVFINAVVDDESGLATLQGELGTYSASGGVRTLTASEMLTGFTGSTINTNVQFTSATTLPAGNTTANAVLNAGLGVALQGTAPGSTLTLGSGMFIYQFGSATAGFGNLLSLDMNGQTGRIFFNGSSSAMILNSAVKNTGPDGLVISSNQVSGGITMGSTDAANNTFSGLTINGGRGSGTTTTLINTNFSADVNLGASTGPITLNTARMTYTPTGTPIVLNRKLTVGPGGAEFAVATTSVTFSGLSSGLAGAGTLTKVGTGTLALTPAMVAPGNYDGSPATLTLNVPASVGAMPLSLGAGANFMWDLRGGPGSYTQDLLAITGAVGSTITIDPLAIITADLTGVDYSMLVADLGGPGFFRDYTVIAALASNVANFAPGQIALSNAPGFSTSEFSTFLSGGSVILRFTPIVPAPGAASLSLIGLALLARRRRN